MTISILVAGLSLVSRVTTGDHYPLILSGLGGGFVVACLLLLAACGLWTGVSGLVWMWSAWVVQFDMDD